MPACRGRSTVDPSYDGVTLFTQWLCLDNNTPGGATVTAGLELVFCHD